MSRSLRTIMLDSSCKMNECVIVNDSGLCELCKATIEDMVLEALTDLQYGHAQRCEENIRLLKAMRLPRRQHFVYLMQLTFTK